MTTTRDRTELAAVIADIRTGLAALQGCIYQVMREVRSILGGEQVYRVVDVAFMAYSAS